MTLYVNGEKVGEKSIHAEMEKLRPDYERVFADKPEPQRQKQLLRKCLPTKKGQLVRLKFSGRSSSTSELSDFVLGYSQQYVVLCTDDQITLMEKNVPPNVGQKPVSISVNRISQIGTFHVVTMRIFPRIITVLLRQQQDDWKWEALLGDTVICVHFVK